MKPTLNPMEANRLTDRILSMLGTGRQSALTAGYFQTQFGFRDDRKIRLAIDHLIDKGWPVLSAVEPPYGYYLPDNQAEVDECYGQLKSRAIETLDRAKKIKEAAALINNRAMQLPMMIEEP
jgi:pyruvate-formate lyase